MTRLNKLITLPTLILLLILIFSCWVVYNVYALSAETIVINWNKEVVETDLTGFELRINEDNSTIIDIPGANAREWSGMITLQDGNNTLGIRAKDQAGQVSIWSKPCYYDPIPGAPSEVTITIKITIIAN